MKKLRIALHGASLQGWGGGVDFMRHIANSLASLIDEKNLEIFLIIPYPYGFIDYAKFIVKSILKCNFAIPSRTSLNKSLYENNLKFFDSKIQIIRFQENGINALLRKINADILLPIGPTLIKPKFPIPHLGFVYDFQHKYLSNLFSQQECEKRDQSFHTILSSSQAIIVHSRNVQNDIKQFFPAASCNVVALPFIAPALPQEFYAQADSIIKKFTLPNKFFIISNQFWQHKDHLTAFKALQLLHDHSDIHIVCTGKTEDYRNPGYFKQLNDSIAQLRISDRIHFLGYLKKEEQIAVMKKSLALINTTLFEGAPGGGAVSDAFALGLPVILSDIPVNLEINQPGIFYFTAQSPESLALTMRTLLSNNTITQQLQKDCIERSNTTSRVFGTRILEVISYVLEK